MPQESVPELALTPDDRHIISTLDNLIINLHNSSIGVDLLDIAEVLMIKGFILRVRGVDLGGLFGARTQLNDSIKICHSILNGFPSAEAAEILSRSALYMAEVLLAIGETDEAREYLTECIQWSQQLGNPERVRNANILLSMIQSTRDNARIHKKAGSYKCAKCGKVLEEILETPRNATNKGVTDKRTFAQAMKCNKCGAMLCWPGCCKMEPCPSCRSTAGFHSTRVYVD